MSSESFDYDWIIVGSGFGGSVSALRLAEKGYRVAVIECGDRFTESDYAEKTARDLRRYYWSPKLGMRGIFRQTMFKDVFVVSGAGVGGGSLGYANTLYRARPDFYENPQWADLGNWERELRPHYDTAERMLGVEDTTIEGRPDELLREFAEEIGVGETFAKTRVGVYLGREGEKPGESVGDPYFGGEGPERFVCARCGSCMIGCRHGAKNTLPKNYLWFAEKLGAEVISGRAVADVKPIGSANGADGYLVTHQRSGAWVQRDPVELRARGVIFSAGAVGTNKLLRNLKHSGSLPRISDRLGHLVRTNSESILAVTLPKDDPQISKRIAITSSIYPDPDTHVELVTYGEGADSLSALFTLLTGKGNRLTRPVLYLGQVIRHPLQFLRTTFGFLHWSRRTLVILVMQSLDNAIRLVPKRIPLTGKVRLQTEQDPESPNPTFIPIANKFAEWLAERTGGTAGAGLTESILNIPTTAHFLGGAVVGESPATAVCDSDHRVFGYENMLVCDGSAVPANPGVNPSLTITAMSERAISKIPPKPGSAIGNLPDEARPAKRRTAAAA